MIFRSLTLSLLMLLLIGCATPLKDSLGQTGLGMDKAEVLELNGNPWITRRVKSTDVWVYRFYEGEQEYHQQLVFESGKIIKVSSAKPHPDPDNKIIEANSMKEFSKAAKQKQERYNQGFSNVTTDDDD